MRNKWIFKCPLRKSQKGAQPQPKHTSKTKKKKKSSTDDKVEKLNELKVKAKQGKKSAIHAAYVQANDIFPKNNAELKKRLAELQKQLLEDMHGDSTEGMTIHVMSFTGRLWAIKTFHVKNPDI